MFSRPALFGNVESNNTAIFYFYLNYIELDTSKTMRELTTKVTGETL